MWVWFLQLWPLIIIRVFLLLRKAILKVKMVINQQAEIALLIIAPIIMFFLVFINWIVILLYSSKFIPINNMILYAALGMFFKAG